MRTQPRGNKGTLVYVDSRTADLLGGRSSPVLRAALDAMAALMVSAERSINLSREEWNCLAEVLGRSHGIHPDAWQPGRLALEIEDADRLERLGGKWGVDAAALRDKAERMSYPQVQYLLFAVRFFRDQAADQIDPQKDEWWTLAYRLDYFRRRRAAEGTSPARRGRPPKKSKAPWRESQ